MNDKVKNIISNILGLLISIVSVWAFVYERVELMGFLALCGIGLSLFLFKHTETKSWLRKFIKKKV